MTARRWTLTKLAVWTFLCVAHYAVRTYVILSGQKEGDLYAYSWSFQAIQFFVSWFPVWLFALLLIFRSEITALLWRDQKRRAEQGG